MSTAFSTRLPVLVLVGATASGKTDLVTELFSEGRPYGLPSGELISADSMQAYRGMDIGTAKPGRDVLSRLPHHLIDIRDPSEQYTAGEFLRLADSCARDILARGRLPLVVGGTGFYVSSFVLGLSEAPAADPGQRELIQRELQERGRAALREELRERDPAAYARIHEHDEYRLTRALEVIRSSGRALSDFPRPARPREGLELLAVELWRPREELYERIEARVDAMFAAGLPREFEELRGRGYGPESPGMKAIGYREFFEAEAEGLSGAASLARARELIVRDTRRYAKRQETFFKGLPGLKRVEAGPEAQDILAGLARDFLSGIGAEG